MSAKSEFEGKNLEAALEEASGELGIPESELHYEIVEQGRRGVLGLGVKNVRIRVKPPLDAPPAEKPARRKAPVPSAVAGKRESGSAIETTVRKMLGMAGLELEVHATSRKGGTQLELDGADSKMLLSRKAELLSAIQFLLNRMARRAWPDAGRIHVVCNGRGGNHRRDDDIVELAREMAEQVARTGRTQMLQPLNSYERRLVHLTVREFSGLTSSSDGQGAVKRIRISKVRNTVS
jgi:spoIIIJ-associated protein